MSAEATNNEVADIKIGRRKMSASNDNVVNNNNNLATEGVQMLATKIAELESTIQKKVVVTTPEYERIPSIQDINIQVDESILCHEFDTEVIDERKEAEDRLREVRNLYMLKIRHIKKLLEDDDNERLLESEIESYKTLKNTMAQIKNEKDTVNEIKAKYQEICRLLQKQNKEIAEDQAKLSTEEKKRMDDLEEKFDNNLRDISSRLEEQDAEHEKQMEENKVLEEKIAQFKQHTILKEEHFSAQKKAKQLEIQLLEAKVSQCKNLIDCARENSKTCDGHAAKMNETEKELRAQITLYCNKFKTFDDALQKSNELFIQFKERMEKMAATISKLEKKNHRLRNAIARNQSDEKNEIEALKPLLETLHSLQAEKASLSNRCRVLQQERKALADELALYLPPPPHPQPPNLVKEEQSSVENQSSVSAPDVKNEKVREIIAKVASTMGAPERKPTVRFMETPNYEGQSPTEEVKADRSTPVPTNEEWKRVTLAPPRVAPKKL